MKYCSRMLFFSFFCYVSVIMFSCSSKSSNPSGSNNSGPIENTTEIKNFDDVNPEPLTQAQVDVLFDDLTARTQECAEIFENVETSDDLAPFFEKDFISISNSFASGLKEDGKINDPKMNIGYIISTAMALNTSKNMRKLVDSLGKYIDECNLHYNKKREKRSANLLKKTLYSAGLSGLGKVLAAEIPRTFNSQKEKPAFPRFVTLHHIQNIVEAEIIPVCNDIIAAIERVEKNSSVSIFVTVDDEKFEIDLSDIYFLDGGLRLLRGSLYFFTVYDMDLYTSSTDQTYSWIDELNKTDDDRSSSYKKIYSMSNDTLYETSLTNGNNEDNMTMLGVMQYNYTRPGFLSIRRNNHMNCYNDLKSAPAILKKAITLLKAEVDVQDDDLIPKVEFQEDIDEEMIDIKQELIEEGYSHEFADNFGSPQTFLDFIEEVLTSPYHFSETIEGNTIDITVNISKFFTDPITDLRKHVPKHKWRDKSNWIELDTSIGFSYKNYNSKNYFSMYAHDSLAIPESLIDSVQTDFTNYKKIYLKTEYAYRTAREINENVYPIDLLDNTGNVITTDEIETLIDSQQFFPYFDDYTFHGIFPGMTREKWIEICY